MYALTLRHPWPWAICVLGKRLENRTWEPWKGMLPEGEPFAIHGGSWPTSPERLKIAHQAYGLAVRHGQGDRVKDLDFDAIRAEVFRYTGIVAVARYGGTVKASDDPWFEGPIAWRLDDLQVCREPIPCRGKQKLWKVPDSIVELL